MSKKATAALKERPVRVNQRRQDNWQELARRLLQSEMAFRDLSYKELAAKLDDEFTHQSLTTKVNRGTFSASFLLRVLIAIGVENVDLKRLAALSAVYDEIGKRR